MERLMNKTFLNGIFVFVALVVLAYLIFFVDDFSKIKEKKYIYVLFDNVNALSDGALIYYNGVNCGSVNGIEFFDRKVKVRLSFKRKVPLNENIKITIKTGGLVGEKYIDIISSPEESGRLLKSGETITGGESITFDSLMVSLNKLSEEMGYSFKKFNNVLDNNEQNINNIFKNLNSTTDQSADFFKNMNVKMKDVSQELNELLKKLNSDFDGPEIRDSLKNLKSTLESMNKVLSVVEKKKDKIGKSIDDISHITSNVKNTTDKINSILDNDKKGVIGMIDSFGNYDIESNYRVSYSKDNSKVYSDFSMDFVKKRNNFINIGVERIGYDNDFNLIMGKFYKNSYFFGGVLDSRPGLGFGLKRDAYNIELYNNDINEDLYNIKFDYTGNKTINFGIEYIDLLDQKDFQFSIVTDL